MWVGIFIFCLVALTVYLIQRSRGKEIGYGFIVCFVFIGIALIGISPPDKKTTTDIPTATKAPVIEHDSLSAYVMAQDFVSSQLKAPSTAKFQTYSKELVQDLGGGRYYVSAYVDAQNSFGAMIRNQFNCTVKYVGNKKWISEGVELK